MFSFLLLVSSFAFPFPFLLFIYPITYLKYTTYTLSLPFFPLRPSLRSPFHLSFSSYLSLFFFPSFLFSTPITLLILSHFPFLFFIPLLPSHLTIPTSPFLLLPNYIPQLYYLYYLPSFLSPSLLLSSLSPLLSPFSLLLPTSLLNRFYHLP